MGTTSPFNCITYIKMSVESGLQIYYSENSKATVIAVVVVIFLLSLLLGTLTGMKFRKIKQR